MEEDRGLELKFNGEVYLATRRNTLLFTFFGKLAMYNHVYMIPEQGEEGPLGGYIWSDYESYPTILKFIQDYDLPQRLNSNEVASEDIIAFNNSHPNGLLLPEEKELELPKAEYDDVEDLYFNDSFPEEWND